MSTSLALSELKKKVELQKQALILHSNDTSPVSLDLIIAIYNKAHVTCYKEYMEGFKNLVTWLTANHTVPIAYPEDRQFKIPALFNSYSLSQLAKVLSPEVRLKIAKNDISYLPELSRIERAIITVTMNSIHL